MIARNSHLLIFVLIAFAVGFGSSFLAPVTQWYFDLARPFFTPPPWLFGPVWTVLYVMIGIAGGMAWKWDPESGAVRLWFLQLLLNGLWSIFFFRFHLIGIALLILLALVVVIILFIRATAREVPWASRLFIPYLLWTSFAGLLNASFAVLN